MSTDEILPAPSRARSSEDWPPWSRFREWVHCICVVTFDLELGQAMEVMYPGDAALSTQEKTNICYLAFPDSNSGASKDTKYHFRIRRSSSELSTSQKQLSIKFPPALLLEPSFLYGFVHFRQQRDPTLPRGYFQKSVVLLSILPLHHLFMTVVEHIALGYFEMEEPAIEAACHDMDQWRQPRAGISYSLPLMGSIIQCRLPSSADPPLMYHEDIKSNKMDGVVKLQSVCDPDFHRTLHRLSGQVQLLWELMIVGEPLLIMSNSPAKAADLVHALTTVIAPLRYANDFRPYFTIHDSEFKEYTGRPGKPPNVVLGVTNPFFVKALQHWPHILKVNDSTGDEMEGSVSKQEKTRTTWDRKTLDKKAGLFTQYKPFLMRDEQLLKRLSTDRPPEVYSTVLQRYLLELTQSFMIPLERYLNLLLPLRKDMSPFKSAPCIRPFCIDEFVETVADSGPFLTCGVKGHWQGLYRKFAESRSFAAWLGIRQTAMQCQVNSVHVDVLCQADFTCNLVKEKHHVEIVDLVLRMRQRALELEDGPRKVQLKKQIIIILERVDEDLRSVLMSNCALRDIVN